MAGQSNISLTTISLRVAFRQFFDWWSAALGAALPSLFRASTGSLGAAPVLEPGEAPGAGSGALVYRLDAEAVLVNSRSYPFDVIDSIDDLLLAEVDRLTPFTADEVRLTHHIDGYDWKARELSVKFAVVQKVVAEAAIERAVARGATPDGLAHIENNIRFDFPRDAQGQQRNLRRARVQRNLWAVLALLLFVLAVFTPALQMNREAEALSARLETLRGQADAGATLRDRAAGVEESLRLLRAHGEQTVSPLAMLSHLTETLPDDAWLISVDLRGDQLRITGYAKAPTELVTRITASPRLTDIQYRASGARDPRLNAERFDLTATIVKPGDAGNIVGGSE